MVHHLSARSHINQRHHVRPDSGCTGPSVIPVDGSIYRFFRHSTTPLSDSVRRLLFIVNRNRDDPAGTVGGRMGITRYPSDFNCFAMCMVWSSLPIRAGTICERDPLTLKPTSMSAFLNQAAVSKQNTTFILQGLHELYGCQRTGNNRRGKCCGINKTTTKINQILAHCRAASRKCSGGSK